MLNRRSVTLWLFVSGATLSSFAFGAFLGTEWSKSEVVPVVLVKPDLGGFTPTKGSTLGNTWRKDEVKPVLLVKPGIGGFEPVQGMTIGVQWSKKDVIPVTLVESNGNGFSAMKLVDDSVSSGGAAGVMTLPPTSTSVIEGQLAGDFEGWAGETIIRLTTGQIWQQSTYYYEYHYAFMPKVLIYKAGPGYKAKVEGVRQAVDVIQLK